MAEIIVANEPITVIALAVRPRRKSPRHSGVIIRVTGARNEACNIETIVGFTPMTSLISTPISPELRVSGIGDGAAGLLGALSVKPSELDESDVAIFCVSANHGVTPSEQELWAHARELYVPSLVVITDLDSSEIDFDDMSAIAGRLLDPVVTPYLVLHSDDGTPAALIDLDALKIHEMQNGVSQIRESDSEHKVLVFEFRKEYLEALEAAGEGAFEQGLLYPALPWIRESGIGLPEIAQYLQLLPSRS